MTLYEEVRAHLLAAHAASLRLMAARRHPVAPRRHSKMPSRIEGVLGTLAAMEALDEDAGV